MTQRSDFALDAPKFRRGGEFFEHVFPIDRAGAGEVVVVLLHPGVVQMAVDDVRQHLVEGVSVTAHHTKPRKQGEQGGIINKECPIRASKLMRVCPKCNKPTRLAHKIENGKKTTVCKKCGAEI